MFNKKLISVLVFILLLGNVSVAHSAVINAYHVFMQAQRGNREFFNVLSRHKNAIDLRTKNGYTAYCLAMIAEDEDAMNLLKRYGANKKHECVKKIEQARKNKWNEDDFASQKKFKVAPSSSGNALLTGLGIVAVGGGVALASSGGGGGGSSHFTSDNKPNNDNTGGNDNAGGGDNTGGNDNAGGDDNTGGGDNTGNDDNTGGGDNTGGDDNTGGNDNTGGDDNTGGNDNTGGGDNTGGDDVYVPESFDTDEYKKSHFLEQINASAVYDRIYKDSKEGKNVNGGPLKEINVGILDTGVYNTADLDGKIIKGYDSNIYNELSNVQGFVDNNGIEYYVVENGGKYQLFRFEYKYSEEDKRNIPEVTIIRDGDGAIVTFTFDAMKRYVADVWNLSYDKFNIINGGGLGNPGYDVTINKSKDTISLLELSHGTHVAGIIAGKKNDSGMHGVAFDNANIVANSFDLSLYDEKFYDNLKKMVDEDGISVLNVSLGVGGTGSAKDIEKYDLGYLDDAYEYTAKNDVAWVQASGNDSKDDADLMAGLGLVEPDSSYGIEKDEVPMIVVAALGNDGKIANYSNKCGSTSGFCLAAPGTDIYSTGAFDDGTIIKSGTSMAAPVVSGSIALLNGYYPWLNGQNVAYLLLKTANKDFSDYSEEVYGQGKLDLEAAVTTPVDELNIASSSSFDDVMPVGSSKLSMSGIMQNKLLKAMPKTIKVFDGLDRPFDYNTENLVNTVHASNANLRNTVSRMAMVGDRKVLKDEKSGFQFSSTQAMDNGGKANLASMEVVNETDTVATRFWYAENSKYDTNEGALVNVSNPYFAMNEAYGAENTLNLSESSKLKLSLQTGQNGLYERDYEQDNHSFDEQSHALNAEYSYNMTDYLELSALGGMLYENDAVLGMNGVGGFSIKDSSTYFMGFKAALNLTDNISLMASYYRGYTNGADASMLSISDLETESFMLAGEYAIDKKNKVGLSLVSPLSVVKGSASFNYATGRDNYSDTIYMNKLTTSLRPEAKEYDLGLYYKGQTEDDVNLMGKVEARFNADGEKGVTDYIGVVGVSSAF